MPPEPTRADQALARRAAGLVTAAQNGDIHGVAELLRGLELHRLARLFMLLGAAADPDIVLLTAGFGDRTELLELHRQAKRLRRMGQVTADMPPHVVAGERMYARLVMRNKRRRDRGGSMCA